MTDRPVAWDVALFMCLTRIGQAMLEAVAKAADDP
jgi:hypothetical protein